MAESPQHDLAGLKIDRDAPAPSRAAWPWVALALALAGGGGYYAWSRTRTAPLQEVDTIVVPRRGAPELLQAVGYIRAQVRSDISSKVVGIVTTINVKEGDIVDENQVIAELENRDLVADVKGREADVELAKIKEARVAALVKANSKAQADLDEAHFNTERMQSELEQAAARLSYTTIRAPFRGLVVRKSAEKGQSVSSVSASGLGISGAIVTIIDPTSLQAEVDVNEAHKEKIAIGTRCEAILEGLPPYKGEVAAKIPVVDRAKSTMLVRVKISNLDDKVLEGMTVRVKFLSDEAKEEPPIMIPESCVLDGGYVWLVTGGVIERRTVVVDKPEAGKVRIFQGLEGGESVVKNPPPELKAGQKVKTK